MSLTEQSKLGPDKIEDLIKERVAFSAKKSLAITRSIHKTKLSLSLAATAFLFSTELAKAVANKDKESLRPVCRCDCPIKKSE